jgi:hypothetical protein
MGKTLKIVGRVWIFLGILPLMLIAGFGILKYTSIVGEIARLDSEAKAEEQRGEAADKIRYAIASKYPNRLDYYKLNLSKEEDAQYYKADKEYYIYLSASVDSNKAQDRIRESENFVRRQRQEFVISVKWWIGFSLGWLLIATTVGVLLLNQAEAKRTI